MDQGAEGIRVWMCQKLLDLLPVKFWPRLRRRQWTRFSQAPYSSILPSSSACCSSKSKIICPTPWMMCNDGGIMDVKGMGNKGWSLKLCWPGRILSNVRGGAECGGKGF